MENTAPKNSQKILITEAGSLLGFSLANLFLNQGKKVYGAGKISPPEQILKHTNFTHLDIDLSQPFPEHIPQLDLIIHILHESTESLKKFTPQSNITSVTNNIVSKAKNGTKVILAAPIETNNNYWEKLTKDDQIAKNIRLFLIGDIYGPKEPFIEAAKNHPHTVKHNAKHFYYHNELTALIAEAITGEKILLQDEGLKNIVPTYIDDAVNAFGKFLNNDSKKIRLIASESVKTALTCAYEIQKIAQLALDKELKLFFVGPEKHIQRDPHPVINTRSLGFEPKTELEDGLKKTFEIYKNSKEHVRPAAWQKPASRLEEIQSRYQKHIQTPKQHPISKLTAKIPVNKSHFRAKKIILALVVIFILTVAKTGLDIFLGNRSAQLAVTSASQGDFQNSAQYAKSAEKSYKSAANKIKLITTPAIPIIPSKTAKVNNSLRSAYLGSSALNYFSQGAQDLTADVKSIFTDGESQPLNTESASANFQQAFSYASQAAKLASEATDSGFLHVGLEKNSGNLSELASLSQSANQLVNLLPKLIGQTGEKSYLILIQNNTELRPGGGVITSFAQLSFTNGKLGEINFENISQIDNNLEEQIAPPPEIAEILGAEQFLLKDSAWNLDFTTNRTTARDLYSSQTEETIDGVITFDLTFLANLLELTGPQEVEGQTISAENLSQIVSEGSSVLVSQVSTQLFKSLPDYFLNSQAEGNTLKWEDLAEVLGDAFAQKHLQISFEDNTIESTIKAKNWHNTLPPAMFDLASDTQGTKDLLAIAEANLSANNVNLFINRDINYQMNVGTNGSLTATLAINYQNSSNTQNYTNFLRVYTPFASSISAYQNGESEDIDEVKIAQASNLQTFSTFVEVPAGGAKTVKFTYLIPKTIKLEKAPSYNLYVSKQPGTANDKFNLSINLPGNIQIESVSGNPNSKGEQQYQEATNLEVDRKFEVKLSRK